MYWNEPETYRRMENMQGKDVPWLVAKVQVPENMLERCITKGLAASLCLQFYCSRASLTIYPQCGQPSKPVACRASASASYPERSIPVHIRRRGPSRECYYEPRTTGYTISVCKLLIHRDGENYKFYMINVGHRSFWKKEESDQDVKNC